MQRALLAAACVAVAPGLAHAQACGGVPSSDGQIAITGGLGLTEGQKSYGATVYGDLAGPLSIAAGYSLLTFDEIETNGHNFGAGAGFELPVPNISLCPIVQLGFARIRDEVDGIEGTVSQLSVPIGFGIGKRFVAGPNFYVTVFGEPFFLYYRTTVSLSQGGFSESFTESSNEFGADLGLRFGTSAFYFGGGVGLTTIEDAEPSFSIALGVLLGGRRQQ